MSYRYFLSGSPIFLGDAKSQWTDGFQALLNDQFSNSTTYQTIQEEVTFTSGSYVDVNVRVNRALSSLLGTQLGDDYKQILFPDLNHATGIGYSYYFSNNFWLTTNTEIIKNLAASATVRRCNNTLRWTDVNGNIYSEPCIIDYEISRPRDLTSASEPVTPQGYINIFTQLNSKTRTIKGNQRFLFGTTNNRICFKVFGDGVRNFLNQRTSDDDSAQLLELIAGGNYVNVDTDDIVNGIADRYLSNYTISLYPSIINGNTGDTQLLNAVIENNGIAIDKQISFITSGSDIASISGSLLTLNNTGSCVITANMSDNVLVSASSLVNVIAGSSTNLRDIRIDPTPSYILEGDSQTYITQLYVDGILQPDLFTYTLANDNVPITSYYMSGSSGSQITITNLKRYYEYPLVINCTTGSDISQIIVDIKGSW